MKKSNLDLINKGEFTISYLELVNQFINNPRDIITKPITGKDGKWFYTYVENGKIIVYEAKEHTPKCSIKKPRVLCKNELEDIYELYLQRKQGKSVSKQATNVTMNQVYWYGIFSDIGL